MIKIKNSAPILLILAVIVLFSLAFNVIAKAEQNGNENRVQNQEQNIEQENESDDDSVSNSNSNENDEDDDADERGQLNAAEHRSKVAEFVQSLLQVADREGGIGEKVKTIAQEQNQSADTTVQAMEKVQNRSGLKTFLIGTDYKNIGTLRSETVKTRNRLEQLKRELEKAENDADKTELQNQINAQEQEQEKIEKFIEDNENKFSLFGWFVKLFNR